VVASEKVSEVAYMLPTAANPGVPSWLWICQVFCCHATKVHMVKNWAGNDFRFQSIYSTIDNTCFLNLIKELTTYFICHFFFVINKLAALSKFTKSSLDDPEA
jgi:hypothetical protein